eukprot:SAG31_NODE_12123_length_966_cov_1.170704_1_plen_156_part_01
MMATAAGPEPEAESAVTQLLHETLPTEWSLKLREARDRLQQLREQNGLDRTASDSASADFVRLDRRPPHGLRQVRPNPERAAVQAAKELEKVNVQIEQLGGTALLPPGHPGQYRPSQHAEERIKQRVGPGASNEDRAINKLEPMKRYTLCTGWARF